MVDNDIAFRAIHLKTGSHPIRNPSGGMQSMRTPSPTARRPAAHAQETHREQAAGKAVHHAKDSGTTTGRFFARFDPEYETLIESVVLERVRKHEVSESSKVFILFYKYNYFDNKDSREYMHIRVFFCLIRIKISLSPDMTGIGEKAPETSPEISSGRNNRKKETVILHRNRKTVCRTKPKAIFTGRSRPPHTA